MKIRIKDFASLLINICFIFIANIISLSFKDNWIKPFSVLVIIAIAYNIISLKKKTGELFHYCSVIYLLISFLHLSQLYCGLSEKKSYYNLFSSFSDDVCRESFVFSFICIHVMIMFAYISHDNVVSEVKKINKVDKTLIGVFFVVLYVIKIFFKLQQLMSAYLGGYLKALDKISSISGMVSLAAEVFAIMYLQYCENKTNKKVLFTLLVILEMVFMLSGSRMYSICYLVILFISCTSKKTSINENGNINISTNKVNYLKLIILLGVGVFLIVVIRFGREETKFSLTSMENIVSKYDFVYSFCEELGSTQRDIMVAMSNSDKIDYYYGSSYLYSFVTLFPNIGGWYNDVLKKLYFIYHLKEFSYWNYGGSIICEAYMNFGKYAVIMFAFIGMFFSRISSIFNRRYSKSIVQQIIIIALCYECILWTRGYFFTIIRTPILIGLVYWIVRKIACSRMK